MRTTARIVVPIVLVYVAYGLDYLEIGVLGREVDPGLGILEHRTVAAYRRLFTFGLAVAFAGGLAGMVLGEPFLAQDYMYVHVPVLGEYELASALVFDVGVYCVVVGGLLAMLSVVGAE